MNFHTQTHISATIVFSDLSGEWQFSREIDDHTRFLGKAIFKVLNGFANTLHYREEAQITSEAGKQQQSYREYLYKLVNDNTIDVYFYSDNKIQGHFIKLQFDNNQNSVSASHVCKQDIYTMEYFFGIDNEFRIQCRVKGPKKNFKINTIFERINAL